MRRRIEACTHDHGISFPHSDRHVRPRNFQTVTRIPILLTVVTFDPAVRYSCLAVDEDARVRFRCVRWVCIRTKLYPQRYRDERYG